MSDLMDELAKIAGLGLFGSLFFFAPLWAPQVVFRGLTPQGKPSNVASKSAVSLTDGLLLMTFLTLVNSLVGWWRNDIELKFLLGLALSSNVLVLLIWVKCQRYMARHQIVDHRSRLLLQTVLYPASVVVAAEMLMSCMWLLQRFAVYGEVLQGGSLQGEVLQLVFWLFIRDPFVLASGFVFCSSLAATGLLRFLFSRFIVFGTSSFSD